jgi:hypothetical protein
MLPIGVHTIFVVGRCCADAPITRRAQFDDVRRRPCSFLTYFCLFYSFCHSLFIRFHTPFTLPVSRDENSHLLPSLINGR